MSPHSRMALIPMSSPTPLATTAPRSRSRQRSSPLILLLQDARAVRLEVAAAEVVFAAQRLDGLDGGHHGLIAHVEHGAVDAEARAHGHEGAVEQGAVGQAEAHVAEAAGGAHGQALLDQLEGLQRDLGGRGVGRDGHDQRVDPEVLAGQPGEDLWVDPLVMAVSADSTAAQVTMDTLKLVKERLPVRTTGGLSNVSFGLPNRVLLNRTFVAMCAGLGIDGAVLDVRNKPMMATIKAIEALRGEDDFCGGYLKAHRAGILE